VSPDETFGYVGLLDARDGGEEAGPFAALRMTKKSRCGSRFLAALGMEERRAGAYLYRL